MSNSEPCEKDLLPPFEVIKDKYVFVYIAISKVEEEGALVREFHIILPVLFPVDI